jgi:hypothetical protein
MRDAPPVIVMRSVPLLRSPVSRASLALLFATLALYSALRSPVPAVNEPHYLSKARHFWQPEWCAGDLFLESPNAHQFFFQTIGALTVVLPLDQAAWAGRLLAFALLSIGWQRCIGRLVPGAAAPILVAWLFLLLQTLGNLSGEWLVGGVEAKVFSYALILWAGGCLLEGHLVRAGLLAGLAVSFHPIVGVWSVLLTGAAWLGGKAPRPSIPGTGLATAAGECTTRPPRRRMALAALVFVGAAIPGLAPAARMVLEAPPDVARQADLIQVAYRLTHHLDPLQFPLTSYRYYGLLLVVWLLLRRSADFSRAQRGFERVVMAALVLAAVGWLVGAGPRPIQQMPFFEARIRLLKFYPFRMADILVPLIVAVTVASAATRWVILNPSPLRRLAALGGFLSAYLLALLVSEPAFNAGRIDPGSERDWLDVCGWLRDHAPQGAVLYSANEDWAVKWYAQRAEYVNFKDCPQDAAGIVEWYRRMKALSKWSAASYTDARFSAAETADLRQRTGITHLVCGRLGPFDLEPVYANRTFRVYQLDSHRSGTGD